MTQGVKGSKPPHGTRSRYGHHHCRCRQCTLAVRFYGRERLAKAEQSPRRKNGAHGTKAEYNNHACRCEPCKAAKSVANKQASERRKRERAR